jgi:hypothetical protein
MLTDFFSPFFLIAGIIGLSSLMILLDKYFTQRRSFVVNAEYTQRLNEGRKHSMLHLVGFENRKENEMTHGDFIMGPEVEVRRPGFLSRRRVVTDKFGRVVATHYEEMTMNNFQPRLMLTAGNKVAA